MGQYYTPVIISENDSIRTLNSHSFGNGLKLMEHSWIGNNFVNAVISLINKDPQRIAWIGDYSDNPWDKTEPYTKKISKNEFGQYYNAAWFEKNRRVPEEEFTEADQSIVDEYTQGVYFVNHTAKQYIDIEEYIKASTTEEGWCVNPLSLLTACGNGRGGGDYSGINKNLVGIWAFNMIEYTDTKPKNYEKLDVIFQE